MVKFIFEERTSPIHCGVFVGPKSGLDASETDSSLAYAGNRITVFGLSSPQHSVHTDWAILVHLHAVTRQHLNPLRHGNYLPLFILDSQGIRIIQSNTSFLLLKYTYIQGYMFQLREAIIRPLP
jgi:hypothetical protein